MKSSAEIRQSFLDFFQQHQHTIVPSSPLVVPDDPSLLFTNAGMVQFKDVFLGKDKRSYTRAVSSQRCVRAGGKHNDLENVGYTARHHTFFEMLGNFSFGDYFKREAIHFSWQYLTEVLQLPKERLWITVFEEDEEAAEIWLNEINISKDRFSYIGTKDNFWSMGETGPCGPCSEIFYDHGEKIAGGPPGSPEEDGDRYIEIWNLVFMQYNRDAQGVLHPLPKPSVDTGMGLERLAAILQGVHNNYEIDIFQNLIKAAAKIANRDDLDNKSLRVIADHIRSCAFLITDGVIPSNEGEGYVLRRIIRRAIRHGNKLGIKNYFFYTLTDVLVKEMGVAYPELAAAKEQVKKVLKKEEQQFARTLEQGLQILDTILAQLSGTVIPGEEVFRLYDTYGFPADLTADIARERQLEIDQAGFDKAMAKQRQRARKQDKFVTTDQGLLIDVNTEFNGYDTLQEESQIVAIYQNGEAVHALQAGQEGSIVLDHTPFYAESGGQVGDTGILDTQAACFDVQDTQKQKAAFMHTGVVVKGVLHVDDRVRAKVNEKRRLDIIRHHSATHLLHAALRQVLGNHVQQKGSLVNDQRLRFDFSHFEPVNADQLWEIEQIVNSHIRANHLSETRLMAIEEAKESGAMALFGEKYGETVRVLKLSDFSVELCGGTHVKQTGDIGIFKIISETGIAAGVRRIEAVAGEVAVTWLHSEEQDMLAILEKIKADRKNAVQRITQIIDKNTYLEKELARLKSKLASNESAQLLSQAKDIQGIKVLVHAFDNMDDNSLMEMLEQFKSKLCCCVVVLASVQGEQVKLVAGVSKDMSKKVKAGDIIKYIAPLLDGKGGGRPEVARGAGKVNDKLPDILAQVPQWVEQQLS